MSYLAPPLTTGLTGEASLIVTPELTAERMGSGKMAIFATPALTALMEQAAQAAIDRYLTEKQQTIGTQISLVHDGATPIGMRVTANAELTEIKGRTLVFHISASDAVSEIGTATHERTLTNTTTLERLLRKKSAFL